jgi:hypothetical protein
MKREVFGIYNIILFIVVQLIVFALCFWREVNLDNLIKIILLFFAVLIGFGMFFFNIITVFKQSIKLKYFNPFKKTVCIDFNEIEKVDIKISGIRLSHCIITIYKFDGPLEQLTNLCGQDSLIKLIALLEKDNLRVERSGNW